jgi:hypothetical protein
MVNSLYSFFFNVSDSTSALAACGDHLQDGKRFPPATHPILTSRTHAGWTAILAFAFLPTQSPFQ